VSTVEQRGGYRIVRYAAGPNRGRVANLRCNSCEFVVDVQLLKVPNGIGKRVRREQAGLEYILAHVARHASPRM
jgi:hypothetical protein